MVHVQYSLFGHNQGLVYIGNSLLFPYLCLEFAVIFTCHAAAAISECMKITQEIVVSTWGLDVISSFCWWSSYVFVGCHGNRSLLHKLITG